MGTVYELTQASAPEDWQGLLLHGDPSDTWDVRAALDWKASLAEEGWQVVGVTGEQLWAEQSFCDGLPLPYTGELVVFRLQRERRL